jgi:hypothetical protein
VVQHKRGSEEDILLVGRHGSVWVVQIIVVGEIVLSAHGLRELVGNVDLLALLGHGRHFDVDRTVEMMILNVIEVETCCSSEDVM